MVYGGIVLSITEMRGKVEVMNNVEMKMEDVVKRVRGMSNWKVPGPDWVQGYWFKTFACLHNPIANALQRCIFEENVSEWMVTERTVLIQKDPDKCTEASKYRSIACLPLCGSCFQVSLQIDYILIFWTTSSLD